MQLFSTSSEGGVIALDQPAHLSPSQIFEKYRTLSKICWAGDGVDLYAGLIRESAIQNGYQFTEAAGTEEIYRWMENCKARFQSRPARRIIGFVTVARKWMLRRMAYVQFMFDPQMLN